MSRSVVYGPVISWRLGRSLGIDPVSPPKACTFDCIYCQLGRTVRKISSPDGFEPDVHVEDVVSELERALETLDMALIDYVTFSGCGEPTLNPELGDMVEAVRRLCPGVPIALLTNASLLWLEPVLEGARRVDFLVAKLDAADGATFRAVNRPVEGITLDKVVEGLLRAREEARGKLAIQSMFLRAHGRPLNYAPEQVERLVELLRSIRPDQVQVNTPTRPPAEAYVRSLEPDELRSVAELLSSGLEGIEVISWHLPEARAIGPGALRLREAITSILERRPCRFHELCAITGAEPSSVRAELDRLVSDGVLSVRNYRGERFYVVRKRV